ncbi:MAG: 5-formyltetrahydrofolate cyclo-ligase [Acidimicrobiales bacterium]
MARSSGEVKDLLPLPVDRPDATTSKTEWRRWARAVRAELNWAQLGRAVRGELRSLLGATAPTTVLTYRAMAQEIDVAPLVDEFRRHRWATTRTPEQGWLTVHAWHTPRERHRLGFEQPVEAALALDASTVGLVLVPGLAFDAFGTRLGHGRGYYDELLRRLPCGAVLVGVGVDAVVVDELPAEAHDVGLTHIITESGLRQVTTGCVR